MIKAVDDFLFAMVFQPIVDRLAGVSSPQKLGRFALTGALVFDLLTKLLRLEQQGLSITLFLNTSFDLLFYAIFYRMMRDFTPAGPNPGRLSPFNLLSRMTMLSLAGYDAIILVRAPSPYSASEFVVSLLWVASLYFLDCEKGDPPARRLERFVQA